MWKVDYHPRRKHMQLDRRLERMVGRYQDFRAGHCGDDSSAEEEASEYGIFKFLKAVWHAANDPMRQWKLKTFWHESVYGRFCFKEQYLNALFFHELSFFEIRVRMHDLSGQQHFLVGMCLALWQRLPCWHVHRTGPALFCRFVFRSGLTPSR